MITGHRRPVSILKPVIAKTHDLTVDTRVRRVQCQLTSKLYVYLFDLTYLFILTSN